MRAVSSANLTRMQLLSHIQKSAVYAVNRKGAKTVPWGAPVFEFNKDDLDSDDLRYTHCDLSVKYLIIQMTKLGGKSILISLRPKITGWMVLKAELKSKYNILAEFPYLLCSRCE